MSRERSASNGRLSWGEQAYNILSQYQAILDIATYLSLNKLLAPLITCRDPISKSNYRKVTQTADFREGVPL
jgi:hypothetical protein